MRKLALVIALLTAAGLALAGAMFWKSADWAPRFEEGVYRTTYQFLLVAVAGGAVSLLFHEFREARARQDRSRQELREFRAGLLEAYHEYKAVKRLLRAEAWRVVRAGDGAERDVLLPQAYVPLLERLNETQLTFEGYKRSDIGGNELLSADDTERINEVLSTVERYLNKVVQEFEAALRHGTNDEPVILTDLDYTSEFVGPGDGAKRIDMRDEFEAAMRLLEARAR